MKKILVTTLALSLAAVSTIDAKRTGVKKGGSKQALTAQIQTVTKDLEANPNKSQAEKLLKMLEANPDVAEIAELELQRKELVAKITEERDLLKGMKSGFLGISWFAPADWKNKAAEIRKLENDQRELNKKIASFRKEDPKRSNTVLVAVATAVATLGIAAAIEYYYGGETGYVRTGMAAASKRAGELKTQAGTKYQELKTAVSNRWNQTTGAASVDQ